MPSEEVARYTPTELTASLKIHASLGNFESVEVEMGMRAEVRGAGITAPLTAYRQMHLELKHRVLEALAHHVADYPPVEVGRSTAGQIALSLKKGE